MYRIGICDDEEAYRRKISESVRNIALKNDIELKIIQYESGIQVRDCEKPDILILDIEMEHIDGLKVRDLLEQTDNDVLIIFCTSHDEIMSEAYGKNVTGFIKKPVKEDEIEKKLLHAIKLINRRVKWIFLNTISGLTKFKISDIVYGIAQGRYVKIYLLDGSEYFIIDKGVSQVYEMLKDMDFARISRSVIINFENVNTISDEIIMTNGVKLKCSRRMKKQIQEDFFYYMCKVARIERTGR
ncbi:LytR/AlgR family response regulator transcription factor [Agathobacter sp.]